MSATTDFIAELVRAANEVGKLATLEKGRLLQRSIVIIRDGRNEAGIPPADGVIDLQTVAASIDRRSDNEVKTALLDAADMIRTLKIVLEAKTEAAGDSLGGI